MGRTHPQVPKCNTKAPVACCVPFAMRGRTPKSAPKHAQRRIRHTATAQHDRAARLAARVPVGAHVKRVRPTASRRHARDRKAHARTRRQHQRHARRERRAALGQHERVGRVAGGDDALQRGPALGAVRLEEGGVRLEAARVRAGLPDERLCGRHRAILRRASRTRPDYSGCRRCALSLGRCARRGRKNPRAARCQALGFRLGRRRRARVEADAQERAARLAGGPQRREETRRRHVMDAF